MEGLEPYSGSLLEHRAGLIMSCGQPDDALCVLAQAAAEDPQPTATQMQIVCEAHLLCGRYADAIEAGERSLGLGSGDDFDTHVCLVAANQNVGDTAKASNAMEAVLRLQPRYTIAIHRSRVPSRHPQYLELLDRHVFPALRLAGLPEG